MTIEFRILDNDGAELFKFTADALRPTNFKVPYDGPFQEGNYRFFGFQYQPQVQLRADWSR